MRRRFWFRYAASGESTLTRKTRAAQYASERARATLAVTASTGDPGGLIKAIIQFAPRFMPGCVLVYVGDTGNKWSYFDKGQLPMLGVAVGGQGSMPDLVLYYPENHWRLLIECVMSHGPVDGKRHG